MNTLASVVFTPSLTGVYIFAHASTVPFDVPSSADVLIIDPVTIVGDEPASCVLKTISGPGFLSDILTEYL
jgi:hypothetical protein